MRVPLFAANWKMHKTAADARGYVREFAALATDVSGVEIVLAPPFTAVHAVAEAARNTTFGVAAQDLYWEAWGAFTGEGTIIRLARRIFGPTERGKSMAVVVRSSSPVMRLAASAISALDVLQRADAKKWYRSHGQLSCAGVHESGHLCKV